MVRRRRRGRRGKTKEGRRIERKKWEGKENEDVPTPASPTRSAILVHSALLKEMLHSSKTAWRSYFHALAIITSAKRCRGCAHDGVELGSPSDGHGCGGSGVVVLDIVLVCVRDKGKVRLV